MKIMFFLVVDAKMKCTDGSFLRSFWEKLTSAFKGGPWDHVMKNVHLSEFYIDKYSSYPFKLEPLNNCQ